MSIKPESNTAQPKGQKTFESILKDLLGEAFCFELARILGLAIIGKGRINNDRNS